MRWAAVPEAGSLSTALRSLFQVEGISTSDSPAASCVLHWVGGNMTDPTGSSDCNGNNAVVVIITMYWSSAKGLKSLHLLFRGQWTLQCPWGLTMFPIFNLKVVRSMLVQVRIHSLPVHRSSVIELWETETFAWVPQGRNHTFRVIIKGTEWRRNEKLF